MSSTEYKFEDTGELIEKALDGALSHKEPARLDDCIVHHHEQRQYYCEYLHMTSELMKTYDNTPLTEAREHNMFFFENLVFNK